MSPVEKSYDISDSKIKAVTIRKSNKILAPGSLSVALTLYLSCPKRNNIRAPTVGPKNIPIINFKFSAFSSGVLRKFAVEFRFSVGEIGVNSSSSHNGGTYLIIIVTKSC